MDTIKLKDKKVKLIAHRGLSGIEKENTCSAFVAAGNRKSYFGIETDVHITKDGYYILLHDRNTSRVCPDALDVEESTFNTVRSLRLYDVQGDLGRGDLMIPTMEEYIKICKRYDKECVFELKTAMNTAQIDKIVSAFKKQDYLDRVLFISFNLDNLIRLRKKYSDLPVQYLLFNWDDKCEDIIKKYNFGIDIDYTELTKEIVDKVHSLNQSVNCWTVNDTESAEKMIEMGVDYITTNILE